MKKQIGVEEKMVSGFSIAEESERKLSWKFNKIIFKQILKEMGLEVTGGYCDPTQFYALN